MIKCYVCDEAAGTGEFRYAGVLLHICNKHVLPIRNQLMNMRKTHWNVRKIGTQGGSD